MEASAVPRVAPAGVAALASPGLLRLLSDDRLVALIRDGNRNAFEAVYDRHYRAILSFCRHMLGGADEAEDAVQHTFIAAYNDLVSSRKPIRLRAWLFTIARNRCLTILRGRRERTALELEEQATDGLAVQVQRRQDLRDLVVDINRLPEDQRAALVLAEIGALTHDEIGTVIGVPKDKVKALIFQARESLLADRAAREADCDEIRAQLSTMRGAALRRTTLRRHLRSCQGCRDYRHELERQRRRLALILPVAPTIALRDSILGVTAGGVTAGAGVAGGGLLGASSLLKGAAGKALIGALLAAVGTTGTILVVHDIRLAAPPARAQHQGAENALAAYARGLRASVASRTSVTPWAISGARASGRSNLNGGVSARVLGTTGQPNNLLTPVWPHEKLVEVTGSAPVIGMPAPTGSPVVVVPAPVLPAPAPSPTLGGPSEPTLGSSGGTASGRLGNAPPHSAPTRDQPPAGLISPGASLTSTGSVSTGQSHSRAGGPGSTWPGSAAAAAASSSPATASGSASTPSGTSTTPSSGAGHWGAGGGANGNAGSNGSSNSASGSTVGERVHGRDRH